jgi:(1->4)-alpha-D-glucan 1-alpha-D-glucosylmutase
MSLVRHRAPERVGAPAASGGLIKASGGTAGKRIPTATYRLQFQSQFTFAQANEAASYLSDLGISDCYCSPLFKAAPGSTHGYDVSRFDQLNPELGGAVEFQAFSNHLSELGLGLVLDIVPNHMGNAASNDWWRDVLQKGLDSPYARWFDIDWSPTDRAFEGKVLLPVLENRYATVLEAGKLKLAFEEGDFVLAYCDRNFPLSRHSYPMIVKELIKALEADLGATIVSKELNAWLKRFDEKDGGKAGESAVQELKRQLREWQGGLDTFRAGLATTLRVFNGQLGSPRSFDKLHVLIGRQHYQLTHWRTAHEEINYRRFFDVTELVSLRMESFEVFNAVHRFVFRLLKEGRVTGLRIDHPDGLWDPKQYFDRLQGSVDRQNGQPAGRNWAVNAIESQPRRNAKQESLAGSESDRPNNVYIVAEKILNGDEPLPKDWQVDGTTGYDFLNQVNGLFVNGRNEGKIDEVYREFSGCSLDFRSVVYSSKKLILQSSFQADLRRMTHRLRRVAALTRYGQDFTFDQCRRALEEVIASFPVYRTYLTGASSELTVSERDYIQRAVQAAKSRLQGAYEAPIDFLGGLLTLKFPNDLDETSRSTALEFVMRFQQLTGPVMAKGLEDTAYYRYNRLLSLNEVGGNSGVFGVTLDQFHEFNLRRAHDWPHSLLATGTHDTKRGEDARARITVLSELPDEWREALGRWRKLNAAKKRIVRGQTAPDANDEYFLYQTLIGAWLQDANSTEATANLRERIKAYMVKALREAKRHTSWMEPDKAYEEAMTDFIEELLNCNVPNPFLEDFIEFEKRVAFLGQFNSLSQVLLKLTTPGVPDFYQGTELWDFSLVDPDNRRPVDYELRRRLLAELQSKASGRAPPGAEFFGELLRDSATGAVKLYLIWRLLRFRGQHRELFESGSYLPLEVTGTHAAHACAFAREHGCEQVIAVVPRLVSSLGQDQASDHLPLGEETWRDTAIYIPDTKSSTAYRNVLTQEKLQFPSASCRRGLPLGNVLAMFPVALLERV